MAYDIYRTVMKMNVIMDYLEKSGYDKAVESLLGEVNDELERYSNELNACTCRISKDDVTTEGQE